MSLVVRSCSCRVSSKERLELAHPVATSDTHSVIVSWNGDLLAVCAVFDTHANGLLQALTLIQNYGLTWIFHQTRAAPF